MRRCIIRLFIVTTCLFVMITVGFPTSFAADEAVAKRADSREKFAKVFDETDQDRNQQLTLEEFQAKFGVNGFTKRDFVLFDRDKSDHLNLVEFASIPGVVPGVERGPLPDPFDALVDRFVAEIDKALGKWNERPETEIDANQFVQSLTASFAKKRITFDPGSIDENSNGRVSRAEARRFIEIQMGVRNGAGVLLRRPNGQVIFYALFLHIDANHNGTLEKGEFVERSYSQGGPEQEFDKANTDGNNHLTVEEFARGPERAFMDPVLEFRQFDTNLDASLSPEEIVAGTVDWRKNLAQYAFPGFDIDRDGKLSLAEFQVTPQANMVAHWAQELPDTNGDGMLDFNEFQQDPTGYLPFDRFQFPLLRFLYFTRLDVNSDGQLDPKEFFYKRKVPDEFFVMNEDGTDWKSLFLFEGHTACGSVAMSADGKSIAFDSWPAPKQPGSAIFVMDLESKKPKMLCSGMMPTWSHDGQFLTCSRNDQPYGVWLIDIASGKSEHLCAGWGAQWSPDGREIAFNEGNLIKIYDIATDTDRTILNAENNPYPRLYWNMGWSPDGHRLCFKGTRADGTHEVATINTTGDKPDLKVHYSGKTEPNADFAWHPKGDRIVFAMPCPERSFIQLYEFNPNKADPPKLVEGQDKSRSNSDACWTPDGKRIIVCSGDF